MRDKVRQRQYVMTLHALDEMEDDNLSIFDVESTILAGKIIERQKDSSTGQWKYLIEGKSLSGVEITVVGRISITGKLVFLTVFTN
ncbi:MAG: hypothetical protein A2Z16_11585 [Chloroflexi bacterium RBG_16_54_18]|nr:MAG: hypothetical protein A2Z16_11585 [Chloroflexi bacterium RBG_16_54_18]